MGTVLKARMIALSFVLCSGLPVIVGMGNAQQRGDAVTAEANESLKEFLRTLDDDKTARYVMAFRDLNGDRTPEAIVYLVGAGESWQTLELRNRLFTCSLTCRMGGTASPFGCREEAFSQVTRRSFDSMATLTR
jgi:hypothetical protein